MILNKIFTALFVFLFVWMAAITTAFADDEDEYLLFSAEEVSFNQQTREILATGHVEMAHSGYALQADQITYNEETGIVRAIGNVKITDPSGSVLYVDEAELDDTLRDGFIYNLRFVFSDGSRLAARDGVRIDGNKSVLNYAVFTPCVICDNHPDRPPSWQVRAVRVTHDQVKKRIYYKNATLEILGLPIIYLPYLSHPDPSIKRASGLLVPEINVSRELGVILKIPYLFVFSPSSDATITPIITTKEGLVLSGEFRKHVGFGQFTLEGSVTHVDERDANNVKTGDEGFRGHFFANGLFDHGSNTRTRVQFQLASDDTYLRRYGFSDVDTLTSELITEGFRGRSYFSGQALWFQGLRAEDIQSQAGYALPLVQYDYVGNPDRRGGMFRFHFNGLALHRTGGMDTRRLSVTGSYEIPYITKSGQILKFGVHLRGDVYNIQNVEKTPPSFYTGVNGTEGRFLPHISASFEWPFIKTSGSAQQTLTPVVSLLVAPTGGNPAGISIEDSETFELTETNIFSINPFPGLDLWEDGIRLSYGLKWNLYTEDVTVEAFAGQMYRFTGVGNDRADLFLIEGAGVTNHVSDLVTSLTVTIKNNLRVSNRMRLDKDTLTIRRNEIDASLYFKNASIGISYFKLNRLPGPGELGNRQEIRLHGNYTFKDNWQIFGDITRNLEITGGTISHGIGVMYVDDCVELSFSWRKSFTSDRDIVPGNSLHFRIRLKHLG